MTLATPDGGVGGALRRCAASPRFRYGALAVAVLAYGVMVWRNRVQPSTADWVRADPNPVPVAAAGGTTTVTWSTGDGSVGYVFVSPAAGPHGENEALCAAGAVGAQTVHWIGPGIDYHFRLYADPERKTLLAQVVVATEPRPQPAPIARASGVRSPAPGLRRIIAGAVRQARWEALLAWCIFVAAAAAARSLVRPAAGKALARLAALVPMAIVFVHILHVPLIPLAQQPFPDCQQYADAARQLAAGQGYVTVEHEAHPGFADDAALPPRYPPGMSLLLTPFALLGQYPHNVQAGARLFTALYVVAGVVTAWVIGGPLAGGLTAGLMGASPFAARMATLVFSDPVAAIGCLALVLLAHRWTTRARAAVAGSLAGATVLVRLANFPNIAALLAAAPVRYWRWIIPPACVGVAVLAIFQWHAYGSPVRTGYGYWLPNLHPYEVRYLSVNPVGKDRLYVTLDAMQGELVRWACAADPARSGPEYGLPNWIYYPFMLLGLFWIFAPPLIPIIGLVYLLRHRRNPDAACALWLVGLALLTYLPYFYQAARFMAGAVTILVVYSAVALTAPLAIGRER